MNQTGQSDITWQSLLDRLAGRANPRDFKQFVTAMMSATGTDLQSASAVYPITIITDIAKAMFAICLQLPAGEAERVLPQAPRTILQALSQQAEAKGLTDEEWNYYHRMVNVLEPAALHGGQALVATFRAYLQGNLDLAEEPDELLCRAAAILEDARTEADPANGDPVSLHYKAALALVGQAGALGLRGKPLWSRWPQEVEPPLDQWLRVLLTMLDHFMHVPAVFPFEAIEIERDRWPTTLKALISGYQPEASERVSLDEEELENVLNLLDPFLSGEEELSHEALQRLGSADDQLSEVVANLVGRWEAWDLNDPELASLLYTLIELAGRLRLQDTIPALIEIVATTAEANDDSLADAAANALASIGEPAQPHLLPFLRYSRNQRARAFLAIAAAEAESDESGVFPLLEQLFHDIAWDDGREMVVRALVILEDPRALPLLQSALEHEDLSSQQAETLRDALAELREGVA